MYLSGVNIYIVKIYPLKQESGVDLDDIISMIQLVCLTEEMDWVREFLQYHPLILHLGTSEIIHHSTHYT